MPVRPAFLAADVLAADADIRRLAVVGLVVVVIAGSLAIAANLVKVVEFLRRGRREEITAAAGGLVTQRHLNAELAKVYERIEQRDVRADHRQSRIEATLTEVSRDLATVVEAVTSLKKHREEMHDDLQSLNLALVKLSNQTPSPRSPRA